MTADVTLRQMLPHTHLRGKSWEYTATYPDGRSEILLAVPKYDFNWQTDYVFAQPKKLPTTGPMADMLKKLFGDMGD